MKLVTLRRPVDVVKYKPSNAELSSKIIGKIAVIVLIGDELENDEINSDILTQTFTNAVYIFVSPFVFHHLLIHFIHLNNFFAFFFSTDTFAPHTQ